MSQSKNRLRWSIPVWIVGIQRTHELVGDGVVGAGADCQLFGVIVYPTDFAIKSPFDLRWEAEVQFVEEVFIDVESLKFGNGRRSAQFAGIDVVQRIVRDQVLSVAIDLDRHCLQVSIGHGMLTHLFDEAFGLESICAGQASHKLSFSLSVHTSNLATVSEGKLSGSQGTVHMAGHER